MREVLRYLTTALVFLLCQVGFGQGNGTTGDTLFVDLLNVEFERGGWLYISLFDSEDSWMEKDKQMITVTVSPEASSNQRVGLPGIKLVDGMAIIVLHDQNGNGKLDFQWLPPKPLEGSGNSNNHRRMGPPLYERAIIDPDTFDVSVKIEMIY